MIGVNLGHIVIFCSDHGVQAADAYANARRKAPGVRLRKKSAPK